MNAPHVLLVDDHEIVRRGLATLLRAELPGVVLSEASTVAEALELIAKETYSLVVLDLNLPGRSGFELLEQVASTLPVLVLSGYPESGFAARALKQGARGYVTKATAATELVSAVQHVLAGRRYVSRALAEALADAVVSDDPNPVSRLSHRELEVIRLIAQGRSLREIAHELNLSEKTIATYRARLGEKLGLKTNVDLTRFALQHQLIDAS
ncbi:MAG: response regulator transcription factor [Archangiaceae bacterium]|nr:response regulator transcription factor [Archangiaceae bacterium]